jgi:hypothetical protein
MTWEHMQQRTSRHFAFMGLIVGWPSTVPASSIYIYIYEIPKNSLIYIFFNKMIHIERIDHFLSFSFF